MKHRYILTIILLSFVSTIVKAQISEVPFSPLGCKFTPQLKWENNSLLLTHQGGVFQFIDEKGSWESYAYPGMPINDFLENGDRMLAVTDNYHHEGYLFVKSEDGGKTYTEFTPSKFIYLSSNMYPGKYRVDNLIQCQSDKNILYACCNNIVYRSDDFGDNWEELNWFYMAENTKYLKMSVHPIDPDIIIFAYSYPENWQWELPGNIEISFNGGKDWSPIECNFGNPSAILFYPNDPNTILVSGTIENGTTLIKSIDGGKTWEEIVCEVSIPVNSIKFDANGTDRLFGCNKNTIYYSDDLGKNWNELFKLENEIYDFIQKDNKFYCYIPDYKIIEVEITIE